MANPVETSVIVPVDNEAEHLQKLLGQIHALQLANAEIIVVDDGRSDGSADIAMAAGANVARHPYQIGKGAAVKSGMRAAKGRLILLMDGDGWHQPEDIPKLLPVADIFHMVVGARGKGSKLRMHRNLANMAGYLPTTAVAQHMMGLVSGQVALPRMGRLTPFSDPRPISSDRDDIS